MQRELGACQAAAKACEKSDVATCARATRNLDGSAERLFPESCHDDIARALSRAERGDAVALLDLLQSESGEARAVTYRALANTLSAGLVDEIAAADHPAVSRALVVAGNGIAREWAQKKLSERPDHAAAKAAVENEPFGKPRARRPSAGARATADESPLVSAKRRLASRVWATVHAAAIDVIELGTAAVSLRPDLETLRGHWSAGVRSCVQAALEKTAGREPLRGACSACFVRHELNCEEASRTGRWTFRRNGVLRTEVRARNEAAPSPEAMELPDVAYAPRYPQGYSCVDVRSLSPAVKVKGGWLAGFNGGEFGGALLFVSAAGTVEPVVDGLAVDDIHVMNGGAMLVVGGLAHMGSPRSGRRCEARPARSRSRKSS